MAVKKKSEKRIKKENYWARLQSYCVEYKKALFVDCDNVSSKQICKIRKALREIDAIMIHGKNTLMKASIAHLQSEPQEEDEDYEERKETWVKRDELSLISSNCRGNTAIIFTNGDLTDIKEIIDNEKREAPAKSGAIAPDDVWIRAGPTGLDPKQTGFFQNLQIQTKIQKSQVEIIADKQIIFAGDKIDGSQAALLDKLGIRPFSYKMNILKVYEQGNVFDAAVLDLSKDVLLQKFQGGIMNLTKMSLGGGVVNKLSATHHILNSFKNLACVSFASNYSFEQAEKMKSAAGSRPAATGAVATTEAKVEEKKEEEEEVDVDMGGLFGGDDDEY